MPREVVARRTNRAEVARRKSLPRRTRMRNRGAYTHPDAHVAERRLGHLAVVDAARVDVEVEAAAARGVDPFLDRRDGPLPNVARHVEGPKRTHRGRMRPHLVG